MVDCGVGMKAIKEHLYDVKYLLLTHTHSDHMKRPTLAGIRTFFPKIQILGNYEVHQYFPVDTIVNAGFDVVTDDYTFLPFECEHPVLTYGFTWTSKDNEKLIYATDTASMSDAPKGPYDWVFLESNYDPKKIEQVKNNWSGRYNPYLSATMTHLSTKQCKEFYFMNRRDKDSKLIELHKSSRFY
ncbi:hypothetical protein HUG15_05580 [Salicibibacter cibarius]|uniref:Metallo-beta-lactamase domain-containing protein n=2 Tax=Salicibibacter cibarius TaxID=2743000 RepID=A0A7T6Z7B1_9BACI|nr:hypothetical protein HUG15_05245 [Salicibibacter cibarius]QQK78194.1 hypothetical protein HUG15_05580 [Salicibibacter cibarius]